MSLKILTLCEDNIFIFILVLTIAKSIGGHGFRWQTFTCRYKLSYGTFKLKMWFERDLGSPKGPKALTRSNKEFVGHPYLHFKRCLSVSSDLINISTVIVYVYGIKYVFYLSENLPWWFLFLLCSHFCLI